MDKYRLVIWQHEVLLGFFETEARDAQAAVDAITRQLPATAGFRCQLQVASGERRILESGPDGLRLLGITTEFQPAPQPA